MRLRVEERESEGSAREATPHPSPHRATYSSRQRNVRSRQRSSLRQVVKKFAQRAIVVAVTFTVLAPLSPTAESYAAPTEPDRQLIDCIAEHNLEVLADLYISRCRK